MPAERPIPINPPQTVVERAAEILANDGPETAAKYLETIAAHPRNAAPNGRQ